MSIQLALDKQTGDIIKNPQGGVVRVEKGRFVLQQVQSKLRTWIGEWLLNPSIGWVSPEDFVKNFSVFDIEIRARKVILGTQGVIAIDALTTDFKKRNLILTFSGRTEYGTIDLTVPWE